MAVKTDASRAEKALGTKRLAKVATTEKVAEPKKVNLTNEDKTLYYDVKRRVLGWEKDNYTKLAVVYGGKGWYKLFDHSAIIYVCQLAKRLKMKAELVSDTDFDVTTDSPVFLFRDFDRFEERLKKLKIYRSSVGDGVVVFDLGYKVDASDLVMMQKENEIIRERANKLVLPKEVFPGLRNEIRILAHGIYEEARKMEGVARKMMGEEMVSIITEMYVSFVEAANGHADMRLFLKAAVKDLRRLDALLLFLSDLRIIEDKKNYDLIIQVGRVQKKVAAALLKTEKKDEPDY